jgi:hypothetical protein
MGRASTQTLGLLEQIKMYLVAMELAKITKSGSGHQFRPDPLGPIFQLKNRDF